MPNETVVGGKYLTLERWVTAVRDGKELRVDRLELAFQLIVHERVD